MMAQEPYLHAIQLIQTVPCLAAPGKLIAVGEPSSRLDEVIPFLASLPNVISYNPVTRQLMLRRRPGFITLEPGRVSITQVADAAEGSQLLEALVEAVNATGAPSCCSPSRQLEELRGRWISGVPCLAATAANAAKRAAWHLPWP
jgi:ArsR family metal-binding transcriptional regulator